MPRKRRVITIKRIECMSTGQEYRPSAGVDDFTGQPIEQTVAMGSVRALPSAQAILDGEKRRVIAVKRELLQRVGMLPKLEQTVRIAPKVMGKRAIAVDTIGLYMSLPRWRRDWGN